MVLHKLEWMVELRLRRSQEDVAIIGRRVQNGSLDGSVHFWWMVLQKLERMVRLRSQDSCSHHISVWMVLHRSLNGFPTCRSDIHVDLAITNLRMVLQRSAKSVHGLLAMISLLPSSKQTKWSIWNATIAISSVFLQMVLRSIYHASILQLS
jgi:hypothetical protein